MDEAEKPQTPAAEVKSTPRSVPATPKSAAAKASPRPASATVPPAAAASPRPASAAAEGPAAPEEPRPASAAAQPEPAAAEPSAEAPSAEAPAAEAEPAPEETAAPVPTDDAPVSPAAPADVEQQQAAEPAAQEVEPAAEVPRPAAEEAVPEAQLSQRGGSQPASARGRAPEPTTAPGAPDSHRSQPAAPVEAPEEAPQVVADAPVEEPEAHASAPADEEAGEAAPAAASDKDVAATKIQAQFRGYAVRKTNPLNKEAEESPAGEGQEQEQPPPAPQEEASETQQDLQSVADKVGAAYSEEVKNEAASLDSSRGPQSQRSARGAPATPAAAATPAPATPAAEPRRRLVDDDDLADLADRMHGHFLDEIEAQQAAEEEARRRVEAERERVESEQRAKDALKSKREAEWADAIKGPLQFTFAIIKPDAVAAGHTQAIKERIKGAGFTIINEKYLHLTRVQAEQFYGEHLGKPFFERLVAFMTSGPIRALVLARSGAIRAWRCLMGPTNFEVARREAPDSLRAQFASDGTRNATHGSDSPISAAREIQFFFPNQAPFPQPNAEQARDYLDAKVIPTLTQALAQLAKQKPANPVLWLSNWLLANNPNKPIVEES